MFSLYYLFIFSLLFFLLPMTVYVLILTLINRRMRPTIVSGVWDGLGVLLAGSGFLLVTAPALFTTLYEHSIRMPGLGEGRVVDMDALVSRWWLMWLFYYVLLLFVALWVVLSRRNKTVFYNVDIDAFENVFADCLGRLDLAQARSGSLAFIGPLEAERPRSEAGDGQAAAPLTTPAPAQERRAELRIEAFPAMSNVTLHWLEGSAAVKEEVEAELRKHHSAFTAHDNPAAFWLMSVGAVLVGMVFLLVGFLFLISIVMSTS